MSIDTAVRKARAAILWTTPWMLLAFGDLLALVIIRNSGLSSRWSTTLSMAATAMLVALLYECQNALRRLKAATGNLIPDRTREREAVQGGAGHPDGRSDEG